MNPLAKTADASRQLLHDQKISADGPGTILRDVETLIEFIGEAGLVTKSKQGNLPTETLAELNARLAAPIENYLKRPLLQHYPNIAGIYVLLRVMALARSEGKRLRIDPETLASWRGLNPVEKYFALLEAWLFHADADVLGGSDHRYQSQFVENVTLLAEFRKSNWKNFDERCHVYAYRGTVSTWNAQLCARFGLIEVQPRSLKDRTGEGCGWIMQKARRTPWGEAVTWAILDSVLTGETSELWMLPEPGDAGFGTLHPVFRPYFPEWKNVFRLARAETQAGTHMIMVKFAARQGLAGISRLLAVPGDATLDDLAYAVLKAFKFSDTEHLYAFRYRDQLGKSRVYNHPETDEGPWASEIELGDTGLPLKGVMKFLFDFGDCWRFELRLERIAPPGKKNAPIEIIESTGEPPE